MNWEDERYPFENHPLPYAFDALEPYIDARTMELHHDRHLQTYIDNLNKALSPHPRLQTYTLTELLTHLDSLPYPVQVPIRRNAGGVYNHALYFETLTPHASQAPEGALLEAIERSFGTVSRMADRMREAALDVFGSGYAFLVAHRNGRLSIVQTHNQDTPLMDGLCPLLNVDVWEHAYYLKHYNVRKDYLDDWSHVIYWPAVQARYAACTAGR